MKNTHVFISGSCALLLASFSFVQAQGRLTPPGPPDPTMKSLDQIEPRTPIGTDTTPGDANSLFKITQPGSYYLTTNLTGVAAKNGIEITASGVTLDLMGFELAGVSTSLDGVRVSVLATNLALHNGTVRNWGGDGVHAFAFSSARNGQYQNLRLSANGGRGLHCGEGSVVVNCTARGNGGDGINASTGSTISGCTARGNGGDGIVGGTGSTVSGCSAHGNTSNGIRTDFHSTVSGCTVVGTSGDGIQVIGNCRVVENTCALNGGGPGAGAGIHVTGSDNRIDSNNVTGTVGSGIDVDAAGNLIIRNSASGNTTNYDIVAGNKVGVIVAAPDSAAISGDTGGAGVGTTNPWANFSF